MPDALASWLRRRLLDLRQRLWAKPLAACVLSVMGVGLAWMLDAEWLMKDPPEVSADSIESLLSIMASSMLVIAIFAAGAMVSAYASASNNSSPRSFPLVLADDSSQNAYSIFVGAFIFGVVGLVAVENSSFDTVGRFVLFIETALVFALVILTFVRWVDRIARLGRQGNTNQRAEEAVTAAIRRYRRAPLRGGVPATGLPPDALAVEADEVGFVCAIDMQALQQCAADHHLQLEVAALPGAFMVPGRPLLRVAGAGQGLPGNVAASLRGAFRIAQSREFDGDPRFGLVVLSEIAGRALSPAVNDPGTAIDVTGRLVRIFVRWLQTAPEVDAPDFPLVQVPELALSDLVEDAFTAIVRDGAGSLEVSCRLMKALQTLASLGNEELAAAARAKAREALALAELRMELPAHLERLRSLASFAD
ncbi:DUF2254 domain-containing protein [Arenimonas sp.]|uniref:DUF2254 domain-containing protein n=1 Tax=Arenimonas sp. TaxID=1872635 RepID=UPI0035AF8415